MYTSCLSFNVNLLLRYFCKSWERSIKWLSFQQFFLYHSYFQNLRIPGVDFINVLRLHFCTNFFFGSFSLVICKWEKLLKKTFVCKICAQNVDEIDTRSSISPFLLGALTYELLFDASCNSISNAINYSSFPCSIYLSAKIIWGI